MKKYLRKVLVDLRLLGFLKTLRRSINFTQKIRVEQSTIRVVSIYGASVSVSERWMIDLLRIILPLKGGVFLDVGANNGQTLLCLKGLEHARPYIGFEPNPTCCMTLLELVRLNAWENVRCIPVGLFESDEILELDLYDDSLSNPGGSVVKDYWAWSNKKPKRSMFVPVMRFSTVEQSFKIPNIAFIKIDVEGAEAEVLESLKPRIKVDRPMILFELLSAYSEDNKLRMSRQNRVLAILEELEYVVFRIIESSQNKLARLEKIDCFDPYYDHNMCNYFALPKEQGGNILGVLQKSVAVLML